MHTHERETAHGRITEGGGGKESETPPPPKKSPKKGFLSILVRFPLKSQSYQVSIPCLVINQRNANCTVFRWQANDGPLLWCLDPLSYHQLKNVVKVGPPPPPPDIIFWLGNHVLCVKPRPPRANNNSGGFDLRHHAVLETLSAADNNSRQFGPRSGPTKCLMFLLIRLCGAQADATSLVSYNKVGVHTSTDVW